MKTIEKSLKEPFKENELEWRPQSQGINGTRAWILVIPYIQSRAIQKRLDEVFGIDGWQDEYREASNKNIICTIKFWSEKKQQWITKENGASETNIEAFKGGISSAFKRCASAGLGVGRYLYELEPVYADCKLEPVKGWNKSIDKKTSKAIYWKTPKIDICKKLIEPLAIDEFELDEDTDILVGLDMIDSVKDLNAYYNEYKNKVKNVKQFIGACTAKKGVINVK